MVLLHIMSGTVTGPLVHEYAECVTHSEWRICECME